jgi:hypothetical protein
MMINFSALTASYPGPLRDWQVRRNGHQFEIYYQTCATCASSTLAAVSGRLPVGPACAVNGNESEPDPIRRVAMKRTAIVGVTEHGNSAELVTVTSDGELLDRRRIDLTSELPTHPYHHEGSWAVGRYRDSPWARDVSMDEAIALIKQVQKAAAVGAREHLEALAATLPVPVSRIAIRVCPSLPSTIEERIADNRAQSVADTVVYREALASAAEARGWSVFWYDKKQVFEQAGAARGGEDIDAILRAMGRSIGPPWQASHKLAAAAALAGMVATR